MRRRRAQCRGRAGCLGAVPSSADPFPAYPGPPTSTRRRNGETEAEGRVTAVLAARVARGGCSASLRVKSGGTVRRRVLADPDVPGRGVHSVPSRGSGARGQPGRPRASARAVPALYRLPLAPRQSRPVISPVGIPTTSGRACGPPTPDARPVTSGSADPHGRPQPLGLSGGETEARGCGGAHHPTGCSWGLAAGLGQRCVSPLSPTPPRCRSPPVLPLPVSRPPIFLERPQGWSAARPCLARGWHAARWHGDTARPPPLNARGAFLGGPLLAVAPDPAGAEPGAGGMVLGSPWG